MFIEHLLCSKLSEVSSGQEGYDLFSWNGMLSSLYLGHSMPVFVKPLLILSSFNLTSIVIILSLDCDNKLCGLLHYQTYSLVRKTNFKQVLWVELCLSLASKYVGALTPRTWEHDLIKFGVFADITKLRGSHAGVRVLIRWLVSL